MMLLAVVLPLATVVFADDFPTKGDRCHEVRLETARARLALYEDPSEKRKSELLRGLRKELDGFPASVLVDEKNAGTCFWWIFSQAAELGADLKPVTNRLAKHPAARSIANELESIAHYWSDERAVVTEDVGKVVKDCTPDPHEADCRRRIGRHVRAGSTEMRPLLRRPNLHQRHDPVPVAWLSWMNLHEKFPDRRERIRTVLATPSPSFADHVSKSEFARFDLSTMDAQATVFTWALQDLLSGDDPRKWEPEDVALAIEVARGRSANSSVMEIRVREIVRRLRGMGIVRVTGLIGPTFESLAPVDGEIRIEHFPDEEELYRHEWRLVDAAALARKEPSPDPFVFIAERWQATDARAPNPNMRAVRALLEKNEQRPEVSP